jgi:hypothetical protein
VIVVKVEMWPKGNESKAREIGRTYIYNDGGSLRRGNYEARVCRRAKKFVHEPRKVLSGEGFARTGRVEDYPRLSYNIWRLVIRALRACFPEEK